MQTLLSHMRQTLIQTFGREIMKTSLFTFPLLGLFCAFTVYAGDEDLKPGLIGTWCKQHTQEEDHDLPGDKDWELNVTFAADGHFVWKSIRGGPDGTKLDDSLTGKWIVKGRIITYTFDPPSEAALKRISKLFAYWPSKKRGQHTVGYKNGNIVLGHDGAKIWIELKKQKKAEPHMFSMAADGH